MKTINLLGIVCAMVLMVAHIAQAATVTWDGSTNMTWTEPDATSWSGSTYTSGDEVIFAGAGAGTVTITGTVTPSAVNITAGSYTFSGIIGSSAAITNSGAGTLTLSGANTYTGGTTINAGTVKVGSTTALGASVGAVSVASGAALDVNGISMANANALTLNGSGIGGTGALLNSSTSADGIYKGVVTLGSDSTIGNTSSARLLRFADGVNSTINTGGFTLTFKGAGTVNIPRGIGISGSGSVVVDGIYLNLITGGTQSANNYTGTTTVQNGGAIMYYANNIGTGNINLNGGTLEGYYNEGFTRPFGAAPGEFQITGGVSGFGVNGSHTINFNNVTEVKWGVATFNPSKFVLGGGFAGGTSTFAEGIDLDGADRTVTTPVGGVLSGVIRNTSGTAAGLIKEGAGTLTLNNTGNTFNGQLTVNNGALSIGSINNVSANGVLGNSALSVILGASGNTGKLLYTGGNASSTKPFTLATGGTGAFDVSTAATTLTLSGQIDGSGALSKVGVGTLTLSGINSYGGITTVNVGTLAIAKQASLASNTAANLNVKNGATLALNVDSAGTAGFDSTALNTLLGNISVASTAAQGLQGGAILAFDTATASGGTFTQGNAIANSTGAFGGVISLTKLGAGTLVFDKANTYTGPTTISVGTLRIDDGGSIAGSLVNNSVFLVNKTGGVTSGTDFPALIGGSGSIALGASTTFTISTPDQFLFSALNTTGGGSIILSGVTTPVFGGLSGATGDLGTIISSGYGSVTALTLNVPSGLTYTYGGVITNGAAGMSLTKIGAGTQILTSNNTYTGTTFLNGGTLAIGSGSTIGKLSGTTGLTFNGGTLQFNRSGITDVDAFPNTAPVTVNSSSTLGATSADAGNANANETIGAVTLNAGQMNFNWSNGGSSGTQIILTSLSRSGTASANFNSGFSSGNSRWKVNSAGTTTAGQIIGPWYTTGGNNAGFASTDYAVYSSDFVAQANIAGSAETTWTTAASAYTTSAGGTVTLTGTRTITALRNTGATTVLTLASGANLETYGLLNGVATLLTVAPGTGGILTTPSGSGNTNLYVNAGAGAITVSAPINDNGVTVTLVKNGSGTLTLSSTTSTFSGGVVLNAGTLAISANTHLGNTSNNITFNGNASLSSSLNNALVDLGSRSITLNNGAVATFSSATGERANIIIGGVVSGSGGVNAGNHGWWGKYSFTNTANTFTGAITDSRPGNDGINNAMLSFNSIADGAGYGNIILNGANDSGIDYGSGAIAPLNLNNRQIILANNNTVFFNNASSQAVNINTDIGFSGTGARQIRFGITGAANHTPGSGINTINGKLTDNAGGAFTPTFNGGTWVLAGTNTYSGVTTLSAGTLSINSLANVNGGASALGTPISVANGTLSLNGVTLQYTGSGHASDRVINLSGTTTGATLDASGAGALVLASALTATGAGSKTLTLTGTSTATNTLGGAIVNSSSATSLTKSGTGTWVLAGSNTYSGATMITNGILMGVTGGACASSAVTVTNTPGNISALAIRVTDSTLPWNCASLAFKTNGVGSQLQFSFATTPSKTLAPLSITGNLTFTGAPVVVVNTANVPPGKYPLLVCANNQSVVPALDLMGSLLKGTLSWGGDNKTLYLTLVSKATIIRIL